MLFMFSLLITRNLLLLLFILILNVVLLALILLMKIYNSSMPLVNITITLAYRVLLGMCPFNLIVCVNIL